MNALNIFFCLLCLQMVEAVIAFIVLKMYVMAPEYDLEGNPTLSPGLQAMSFDEMNYSIAEHQEQYKTLPALVKENPEGEIITCWELTWKQRLQIMFTGKLWASIWTFKQPLQPLFFTTVKSDLIPPNTVSN